MKSEIEKIIEEKLGLLANDDVLTVVILHQTVVALVAHIMEKEGENNLPPPLIDNLLTICASRVREFYQQRNIQTIADVMSTGPSTLQ